VNPITDSYADGEFDPHSVSDSAKKRCREALHPMPSDNPTPLCDANCCYCEDSRESAVVGVSYARRIEKVMHGLADAVKAEYENQGGLMPVSHNALAEYGKLMKTVENKEGVEE